ncbi:MAG: hypothetical protein WKF59_16135 [Chitinophagaceae bacterium]
MKKHLLVLSILAIGLLNGCKKNTEEVTADEDLFVTKDAVRSISGQFVPNELLVKFKSGTSEKSRTQTLSFINGEISEHIVTSAMKSTGDKGGVYLVKTNTDVFASIARMKGESNIEYAEPNWIYTHQAMHQTIHITLMALFGECMAMLLRRLMNMVARQVRHGLQETQGLLQFM